MIIMAASLPTSAELRKVREQATQAVNERFEAIRTPLLAWLGANDLAASTMTEAVTKARARAAERREAVTARAGKVQERLNDLPNELSELRSKLTSDELRKYADTLSKQAKEAYDELAKRGEAALVKIRQQPQVARALKTFEGASGDFEARVDGLVDDVRDAADNVLGRVSTRTRSAGEKAARATESAAADAAEAVADAGTEAGADAAEAIHEAGDQAAHTTRRVTRKAANRTEPSKPATARRTSNGAKRTSG